MKGIEQGVRLHLFLMSWLRECIFWPYHFCCAKLGTSFHPCMTSRITFMQIYPSWSWWTDTFSWIIFWSVWIRSVINSGFFLSHINDEQLWIHPHLDGLFQAHWHFFRSLYCSKKLQVQERLPLGCFSVSQLWNISVTTSTIVFMEQEKRRVYF